MTTRPRKSAPAAAPKKDFKAIAARAKLPEKTVPICMAGDLVAEFEEIDRQLIAAMKRPSNSLAGSGTAPLRERLEQLQAEMEENTYVFRLRALPRTTKPGDDRPSWRALMDAHPPRQDAEGSLDIGDVQSGVNRETFFEPFLRASIVDPVMTDEEFAENIEGGNLTDRQYDQLVKVAWDLNQGTVDIPFSRAALLESRISSDE